jgi:hypothetical protein
MRQSRLRAGDGVAHRQQQPVCGSVQDEAHLVGKRRATTGAVGGELGFVQLDQVLRLSAAAIKSVIEPFGAAELQVGYHVPDVQPLAGGLDPRGHAALAGPGFGAIAGLRVAPHHLRLALGMPHPDIIGGGFHQLGQHRVA